MIYVKHIMREREATIKLCDGVLTFLIQKYKNKRLEYNDEYIDMID